MGGVVFESTKITNALLDGNALYQLDKYSKYSPAPISIQNLLDHGKQSDNRASFLFLKKEIPTRLANMVMELRLLPEDLLRQKECTEILNDYITSFRDLVSFEDDDGHGDLSRFNESLHAARRRHLGIVPTMATAVIKLRAINQKCNILEVAYDAYDAASHLCDGEYFNHPKLSATALDTTDSNLDTQGDVTVTYVPAHLHHIFFEIFKNSMRATCEFSEKMDLLELPRITCSIFKTKEDITIKISDLGGGINRRMRRKVFNYMFSTAPGVVSEDGSYGTVGLADDVLPMHGLGYGLPLSRVYARYFKGDIVMASVDGHGTDTYVYLQRLSHMATESLPVYNSSSSARLKSISTQVPDWTDSEKRD